MSTPEPFTSFTSPTEPFTKLYDYSQAASYLGIGKRAVERAKADGRLKAYRPGKYVLFTKEMLDDYIKACSTPPVADR